MSSDQPTSRQRLRGPNGRVTSTAPPRGTRCRVRAAADFEILAVTGDVRALLGWSPRDMVGRTVYEFVHPSDLGEMRRSHESWLQSPLRQARQYRIRHKNGDFVWIESDRQSLHDETGAVIGAEAEWQRLDSIPEIAAIIRAIEESEFILHYQPIVSVETGELTQLEALIRWPREGQLASPATFIPLAEQSGVVRPLTQWVIERALADRTRLTALGIDVPVAVNISLRDLVDPLFDAQVLGRVAAAHARPQDLVLEVTESAVAEMDSHVVARIAKLAAAGLVIAIDDFGSGQSSIARLANLSIGELKFDNSLTRQPETNAELFRIVTAIGRDRGLRVVAEGVERREQFASLRAFGVGHVQGYFIARPMAFEGLPAWYETVSRQHRLL